MTRFAATFPTDVDCARHDEHARFHHPHPDPDGRREDSARRVCVICHPPAAMLTGEWTPPKPRQRNAPAPRPEPVVEQAPPELEDILGDPEWTSVVDVDNDPVERVEHRTEDMVADAAEPTDDTPNPRLNVAPGVHLWTDGASSPDGRGGWAFILQAVGADGVLLRERVQSEGAYDTTNNRMELTGVIEGLRELTRPTRVTVHSDSKYVTEAFNQGWLAKWKAAGWERRTAHGREPVKNDDLWRELDELAARHAVTWLHVKGHNGDEMNERCDRLAVAAKIALEVPLEPAAMEV